MSVYPITVTMTGEEMRKAVKYGGELGVRAIENGYKMRYEKKGGNDRWRGNIEGCCAEIVAARAHRLVDFIPTVKSYRKPDMYIDGFPVQVRSRITPSRLNMPVRQSDRDPDHRQQIFMSVTGAMPTFIIHGWLWGFEVCEREAEFEHYPEQDGTTTFFVQPDKLHTCALERREPAPEPLRGAQLASPSFDDLSRF